MSDVNDEKIMTLKSQILEKKAKLKKAKKFSPITNCSIEIDAVRHNLNVLTKDQLIMILVKLNALRLSAIDLDLLDECNISGYNIEGWITDIKSKLDFVSIKIEENKLQDLENKLHILLSSDKRVELEIDSIESLLK